LKNDIIGIKNCNTFSVVPSIINENAKKQAVPLLIALPFSSLTLLPLDDRLTSGHYINLDKSYKSFCGRNLGIF
jgi:hypothetical protein